jgi:phosphoribosylamine--glycine ligase
MEIVRGNDGSDDSQLDVLVIGGGGRDHALCHALVASPRIGSLHAAPGNAGIAVIGTCHELELDDLDAMVALAVRLNPDLVLIGAEDLLVAGLASRMQSAGLTCLGPTEAAARLEGSKQYAKQLMERAGVSTPPWRSCTELEAAYAAIDELGGAVAVKADGLAAGCGAFVCPTPEQARAAVDRLMDDRIFGEAGARVLVEQLVDGEEASVMALVDGERIVPLPAARDYKRLGDGDTGPNTGGMGAHVPSTDLGSTEGAQLARAVIQPIVDELAAEGAPFRGIVYAGVMLTADGPQVLEYNCRFGNPETQALVRVLDADLLDLLHRAATGRLDSIDQVDARGVAVAVCVAAEHYPDLQLEPAPVLVTGLDAARQVAGVELFVGLATKGSSSDELLALGGRVVTVSAWAADYPTAVERAHEAAGLVQVAGRQVRGDIGQPALAALAARC